MTAHAETTAHASSARDVPALKALWHTVFGDDMPDIDRFFDTFYSPELAAVITISGQPVAAAYAVPDGELVLPGGRRIRCAMIYAVATHPDFRGHGYGAAVTEAAAEFARAAGYPAVVLKPADSGLFDFYEKHTEFRPFFDACEFQLTRDQLPAPACEAAPVSAEEYRRFRNVFLAGTVYIDTDSRGLRYQQSLCAASGGGLFALKDKAGTELGCAIVEPEGADAHVKELLLADGCRPLDAVSALGVLFGAALFRVRVPLPCCETPSAVKHRFGMLAPVSGPEGCLSGYCTKWYGLAFD